MQAPFITPLLRLLLPLVVGIAVGEWSFSWLSALPLALLWPWLLAAIFGGIALLHHDKGLLPLQAATCFLGIALLLMQRQGLEEPWPKVPRSYRAVVSETPQALGHSWRVHVRLLDAEVYDRQAELLLVGRDKPLSLGDALLFHAQLDRPTPLRNPGEPDRAAYLRRQGITGTAIVFAHDWTRLSHRPSLTWRERALLLRESLVGRYKAYFQGESLGILAAMTLGDRSLLAPSTRALYAQTGSSHVLALSGLHLAIIFLFFQSLTTPLRRHKGIAPRLFTASGGLLLIWSFALLVGFPLSLVRAAIMLSLTQLLALFTRRYDALHGLTLAALFMLLWSPQWLFDVGFQLSCAAVAGIVLLRPLAPTPSLFRAITTHEAFVYGGVPSSFGARLLKRAGLFLWELFFVSLSAQLATLPLIAFYFHQLSWSSMLSSFIIVPAAHLLLATAFLFLLLPFGQNLLADLLSLLLSVVKESLQFLVALPYSSCQLWPSNLTVLLAYALLFFILWTHREGASLRQLVRYGGYALGGLSLMLSFMVDTLPTRRDEAQIIVYRHHRLTALHCLRPSGQSYLLASDTALVHHALAATSRNWWAREGLTIRPLPLNYLHTQQGAKLLSQQPALFAIPHVLLFAGKRWAVVDTALPYVYPRQALEVHTLLLARGARGGLAHLLRHYRPQRLVLCASLSEFSRKRYVAEAQNIHLPVHDVEREGVYTERKKQK